MIERKNYFAVLEYLDYQEKIFQISPKSTRRKWAYLRHLLEWADNVPFPKAHKIPMGFPRYLLTARNDDKEKQLSPISMKKACGEARRFFQWAKINKPGKYKQLPPEWIETIYPAKSSSLQSELIEREYYTLEEVRQLVNFRPERFVDERDRAAVALLFLSGMRLGAFVTLPAYCVDLENMLISQLPSEGVETKNRKAAKTYLLPIDDLLTVVKDWDQRVRADLGEKALWYPNLSQDGMDWSYGLTGSNESRQVAFRRGLKRFCNRVGIKYKSPHKLRNGHAVFGIKHANTTEKFKAFSQNMMHSNMEITDGLYGHLALDDVREVIMGLETDDRKEQSNDAYELFQAFLKWNENRD